MAAANSPIEHKCSFCARINNKLEDPRELPCGYVSCKSCVVQWKEQSEEGEVTCHCCYVCHQQLDFDSLRKVDIPEEQVTPLTCDGVNCQVTSVSYCENCGIKMCHLHQQNHEEYFGSKHAVISIGVYQKSPSRYEKVLCDHHNKEPVIKACEHCYNLVCNLCDRTEGHCADSTEQHKYRSLEEVSEKATSRLRELLKQADNLRLNLYETEKQSWSELDVIAEECKWWTMEIERVRDEQITEESESKKEEVHGYLQKSIKDVEIFSAVLLSAKDQLEVSCVNVRKMIEEGHMADLIKQTNQMMAELTQRSSVKFEQAIPSRCKALIVKEKSFNFNVDVNRLPASLTLVSEIDTDGSCFSAYHQPDGKILVACSDGLKVLEKDTDTLKPSQFSKDQILAVVERHHVVYLLSLNDEICKVSACLSNYQNIDNLFSFECKSEGAPSMAVSDQHIVVYNISEDEHILYNITTQEQTKHNCAGNHPYFDSEGQLLIIGTDQLIKYDIADQQLIEIWTSDELPNIGSVCADNKGITFVITGKRQAVLFFVSQTGDLLGQVHHDKLSSEEFGQISIRDSQLAVPGWHDRKLYLFRIEYPTENTEEKLEKENSENDQKVSKENLDPAETQNG